MTAKEREQLLEKLDLLWQEIGVVTMMLGRVAVRIEETRLSLIPDEEADE